MNAVPVFQLDFEQDLARPLLVHQCGAVMFTGDNDSDTITVTLTRNGQPANMSGAVLGKAIRHDGALVVLNGSIVGGNKAKATLTEECFAVDGPLVVMLQAVGSGKRTTLLKAVFMVNIGTAGVAIDPGDVVPDIADLVAMMEAMEAAANDAREAAELAKSAVKDEPHTDFVRGDMIQTGQVYRLMKPGDFELMDGGTGCYLAVDTEDDPTGDPKKAHIKENEHWSIYSWRPPERMMFRFDLLEENPTITGVLPMGYRLGEQYYALDQYRRGECFVADEILVNVLMDADEYVHPVTRTYTPSNFGVFYLGAALVSAQNPYGCETQTREGWNIYGQSFASEKRMTIEAMEVNPNIATGGVLPMGYIGNGSYHPLTAGDEGSTIKANVLVINCNENADGGSGGDSVTVTPSNFSNAYPNHVFLGNSQGVPSFESNEYWDVYKLNLGGEMSIRIDNITVNYRNVYPAGYELNGEKHPIDTNEVGLVVTADALLVNHQHSDNTFSMANLTYTPNVEPSASNYSITSVTYTADETSPTDESTRRQAAIRRAGLSFIVRRDFEDSILYTDLIGQCDSIVVFGDSIFAGYMPWDSTLGPDHIGKGVTQQVAEMLGLPMTNYAVPGALLTENPSEFKTVVEQVRDWTKPAGTTPLILLDGGTNDSYEFQLKNIGEYGSTDTSTIYGAMQSIIDMLVEKGVDRRHIVITTPIPNGIRGDAEYVTSVDRRNTAIGTAMWQVGVTNRCSVINGYHTIFGQVEDQVHKEILMPDDVHPSFQGAAYYADHIVRLLGGKETQTREWLSRNVAHPMVKGNVSQNGRVFLTLSPEDFSPHHNGARLVVDSEHPEIVNEVEDPEWDIWSYKYFFEQNYQLRVDGMTVNPAVSDVLPMAYQRIYRNPDTGGENRTDYPLPSTAIGNTIETSALLVNRRSKDGAMSIRSVDVTVNVKRDFDDIITCGDHISEFTDVVVFGDSIWANHLSNEHGIEIDGHLTNSGVMDKFCELLDVPQENHALGGATISAMQATPKSVWHQVREWTQQENTTPLIMINGGTNDMRLYQLCNMGSFDHIDPIEIYGGLDEILAYLIGAKGIQPWQIVVTTPIPKGIRANAYYTAIYESQLTSIGYAMYEICLKYGVSVINGFRGPLCNLNSLSLKIAMLPDDTHPSAAGAALLARHIYNIICLHSISCIDDGDGNITIS